MSEDYLQGLRALRRIFVENAFAEPEFGSESRILEILHALLSPRLNLLCLRLLAVAGVLSPSFCSCHHESYRRFLANQEE